MSKPLISLVICTYNRCELLAGALGTAARQTLSTDLYEILVVDNNSTDATKTVVEEFASKHANVRYILEEKQGLSNARNRGWMEASGEYIGYTDDDCLLPEDWLLKASAIIERERPYLFGGPFHASYNSKKPKWFKDSYLWRELAAEAGLLQDGKYLRGFNMFFRRALLREWGGFDPKLGMNGLKVAYGEDGEIQRRIRASRPDIRAYYDPALFVFHIVRPEKMTIRWNMLSAFGKGRSRYRENGNHGSARANTMPSILLHASKMLVVLGGEVIRGLVIRDRKRYPYYRNYLVERVVWRLAGLGTLYERFLDKKRTTSHAQ